VAGVVGKQADEQTEFADVYVKFCELISVTGAAYIGRPMQASSKL